jgi:hypothetical protein
MIILNGGSAPVGCAALSARPVDHSRLTISQRVRGRGICHALRLIICASVLCVTNARAQDKLDTYVGVFGTGGNFQHRQTGTGPSLSDSASNGPTSVSALAVYGAAGVTADVALPPNTGTASGANDDWSDTLTINATDAALTGSNATLRTEYHARGIFQVAFAADGPGHDYVYYTINIDGQNVTPTQIGFQQDCASCTQALSNFDTFTIDRTVRFGSPVSISAGGSLSVSQHGGNAASAVTQADITLGQGAMTVLDGNGQPTGFTSSSEQGNAMGAPVASGVSYAGLSLTNDTNNNHVGSTVLLKGGTASTDTYVHATFTAPLPARAGAIPVSDAVDLGGTNSDIVVVQLSFSKTLAQSIFGDLSHLGLAWFDPVAQTVRNAVEGNNGGSGTFVNGPYDSSKDFHLGFFGVDLTNAVVWAVVNHNSQFVVTDLATLQVPSITSLSTGHTYLKFLGTPNAAGHIEVSSDLSPGSWIAVATVTAGPDGTVVYEDAAATGQTKRFYRFVSP